MTQLQEMHAIETKFSRCARYIEKYFPEVQMYVSDDKLKDKLGNDLEKTEEKIDVLLKTIEPRLKDLQKRFAEYETKIDSMCDDATEEMRQRTEEMADKVFDHEDTVLKLKIRLERIRKMKDRVQMLATRLSSQGSIAVQQKAYERLQRIRNETASDDNQITGSNSAKTQNAEADTSDNRAATNAAPEQRENANRGNDSHESEASGHSVTAQQINRNADQITERHLNATDADQQRRNPATGAKGQTNATDADQQSRNPTVRAEGQTNAENAEQQFRNPATRAKGQATASNLNTESRNPARTAEGQSDARNSEAQNKNPARTAGGQSNARNSEPQIRKPARTAEELTLQNRDGQKWRSTVAVTPTIGSRTLSEETKIVKQIPRELVLADKLRSPEYKKVPIDVMIGNDYYLIQRDRMEISYGLRLINSAVKWVLTGRIQSNKVNHGQGHVFMYAITTTWKE